MSVGQPKSNIDQKETRKHHTLCALFNTPFKCVSWSAAGRGGLNSGLARLFSSEGKFEYTGCDGYRTQRSKARATTLIDN